MGYPVGERKELHFLCVWGFFSEISRFVLQLSELGVPCGERKLFLDFDPVCELVHLFLWMLASVCAVCVSFFLEFLPLKMGSVPTIPKESPLSRILGK